LRRFEGKVINRVKSDELSMKRVLCAVYRRLVDLPHSVFWNLPLGMTRINRKAIQDFRDRHNRERCFILGNGPSLKDMDLSKLSSEYTIGLNRIYLLFDEISFQPSYYVCVNDLVLEQFAHEIDQLTMPKFMNWQKKHLFSQKKNNVFIKTSLNLTDYFCEDLLKPICSGGTVTYVALQIAYYMGFQEVILIGVDHNFVDKGIPNEIQKRQSEQDLNHFHPEYFPKGIKWQLPDLRRSELAYSLAKDAYEKVNRRIYDATLGGHCQVFSKVDFQSLFST
jgi:hypothetical protein